MKTYGELRDDVRRYLYDRKDLETMIPKWINLAERRIFRLLRCPANEKLGELNIDAPRFQLPEDFLELRDIVFDGRPLRRLSAQQLLAALDRQPSASTPSTFGRISNLIYLHPIPAAEGLVQIMYYADFSGQLQADTDTNEVLRIAPDLYIYGAMIEASPFLGQDSRTQVWRSMFDEALAQINSHAAEADFAGSDTMRVDQPFSDDDGRNWR